MLNFRDLQYFIVFADELSFSRASSRLGVSQPTLSLSLKRLEEAVGGRLVERTTRRSRLTPAGETLAAGAHRLLEDLERLQESARATAAGRSAEMRVGSVNPALRVLMPRVLREVGVLAPDVRITLHPASSHAQLRMLAEGRLDVGLLRAREAPPGLRIEQLIHEPLYCAFARTHHLAGSNRVKLAELNGLDFVMNSRDRNPLFYDELIRTFADAGCAPRRIVETDDMWAQLALIGAGTGVAVLPLLFVDHGRDDLAFVPLGQELNVPLSMVWTPDAPAAGLSALRRATRSETAGLVGAARLD